MNTKSVTTSFKRQFLPQFSPNLDFYPSMGAEMKEEEDERERNEREGCLDSQFDWNLTRMLTFVKNISLYRDFDRNRLIKTIDGYDETVNRGPFRLSRDHQIVMDGHDLIRR